MTERVGQDSETRGFSPLDRVRRAEASEGEPAGEDYFVLDLETGKYYSLGEVGGFIWQRLDGSSSLARIAEEVSGAFEVGASEARSDVLEFVGALADLGLIEAE